MQRSDYTSTLDEAAKSGKSFTAEVPLSDMPRVTRQLRYQAAKMGLEITIVTDKQKETVTVRCRDPLSSSTSTASSTATRAAGVTELSRIHP